MSHHIAFDMNDVIALSHMKLALLSRDQRVDSALLLRSILIVNALEAHQAAQYSEERWLDQMPPSPNDVVAPLYPATPKLSPISEDEEPIDLDNIFLEPAVVSPPRPGFAVAAETSHVEVVEVGDSDDDYSDDEDYASMASSVHSVVAFSAEGDDDVFSPLSPPVQPAFEFSFPSSPSAAAAAYDDFSDDDGDEIITPPQPALLDDFKGDSDFGAFDDNELEAVEGLQLFGAPVSRL